VDFKHLYYHKCSDIKYVNIRTKIAIIREKIYLQNIFHISTMVVAAVILAMHIYSYHLLWECKSRSLGGIFISIVQNF